ncbi:serine/arginine repetitive matrix protein 2 [Drosophila grimshawi]|uniref:GH15196 n=1 Tax=Drosophila grimshawi TaxID=7222 RepID=B4IXR7_DROGR|nr:serine/arginine repetitive matrix protein 2 [Drosophila grimshawi]EDV96438.1 GH15196 [Drosophila grimshawi]
MSQMTRIDGDGDEGGGGVGVCGGVSDAQKTPFIADELQDGENSLEPGELVTPPHQQAENASASPAPKKLLAKDVMNKALRKLTQIDTAVNCGEKERAILELEAIRRKETTAKIATNEKPSSPLPLENGSATAAEVSTALAASTEDADDSEGLYSDTDSSADDEQKNVEDVQQARKEKQEEAAAAAAPQPPAPHHPFLGMSPLRFHMRPPCFDYSRLGYMPRMQRGGIRGARSPLYPRPPAPKRGGTSRGATPPPSTALSCNGIQGQQSSSAGVGAYGPALPPGQTQGQGQGGKRPQSVLIWTTSEPPVSFVFNFVSECGNPQHKSCKPKESQLPASNSNETASDGAQREQGKRSRDTPREREENHRNRFREKRSERSRESKTASSRDRPRERSRERYKEKKRERSNEKQRARSKEGNRSRERRFERYKEKSEHFKAKPRERSREKRLDSSKEKQLDRSNEKRRELSKERQRDPNSSKDKTTSRSTDKLASTAAKDERRDRTENFTLKTMSSQHRRSRSKSRKSKSRAKTPPLPQANSAAVQDAEKQLQQTPPAVDSSKSFDIFAESPPRLNKPGSPIPNHLSGEPTTAQMNIATTVERSTTPPLEIRHMTPKPVAALVADSPKPTATATTPQLKIHSEIHIRIGALLEENDPHLEALLATKEQLLRQSTEHRNKKEAPKDSPLQIKQEPIEPSPATSSSRHTKKSSTPEHRTAPPPQRHTNPFKREIVLNEVSSRVSPRRSTESLRHSMQRNGDRHNSRAERDSKAQRQSDEFKERAIKQEKNRSRTPPLLTVRQIKVERDTTPPLPPQRDTERDVPVRNGVLAANAPPPPATLMTTTAANKADGHSPDTDDYIDNWENDDSMAFGDSNTPKNPASTIATRLNGDDEDSNSLWNTKSTPPPKSKQPQQQQLATASAATEAAAAEVTGPGPAVPDKALINIQDLYEKFMKSIKMGGNASEATTAATTEANTNSSLSNSTAEESSSDTEATTSSSSSSSSSSDDDDNDDDDDDDSSTDEDDNNEQVKQQQEQQLEAQPAAGDARDVAVGGKQLLSHKKNNVSKDLRKLKSLEDNLARIQMMRENYDSGDDICEELLKMESLFLMQRNAIMNKYRKPELKPASEEEQQRQHAQQQQQQPLEQQEQEQTQLPIPESPINKIFDANREAIKLTISPLKLSRKPAIFDKDEAEVAPQPQPLEEKLTKPPKEIAIVKPTIVETRTKQPRIQQHQHSQHQHYPHHHSHQQHHPHQQQHQLKRSHTRERSRSRSISRNRFRRNVRPSRGKDSTRSPSPRRRRPMLLSRRPRFGKGRLGGGRSRSRSASRSRTRSRSPLRWRSVKPTLGRRRGSLSPPCKMLGPRSPPPKISRRRSYSRERCFSRSPLPFKPPSPPMRRSWTKSRSRSRSRRRSHTRSKSRSRSPHAQIFDDYFVENQRLEAAAYYYNMSLMQQDASGEQYDSYAAYMDTAYNMDQAYAQYKEYSSGAVAAPMDYDYNAVSLMPPSTIPVLRELPMAPVVQVAVQKGNVLEIVPSMEPAMQLANIPDIVQEEPPEDNSKPKRKRVNFVDNVLPTYESDSEDRIKIETAVERGVSLCRDRCAAMALRLQRIREQLLAMPAVLPPVAPKPPNQEKPVLVQKKPRFRYYHFEPMKGVIVKSWERKLRPLVSHPPPRFDPKYMAMLVKSGRLPMPAFLRHRPPPLPAQADAMLQEFFSKHPPPPLQHGLPHYLRGPPPMATVPHPAAPPPIASQPIPVLGAQSYPCYPPAPAPVLSAVPSVASIPAPVPVPVSLPLPLPVPGPVPILTAPPLTLTPPPALVSPYFTPPPLPTLSSHFTVQPVPTMREIMPVDILQKIGPLPKTLDLDVGNTGLEEANTDLNEDETTATPAEATPDVDQHPPPAQLVETL